MANAKESEMMYILKQKGVLRQGINK